MKRKSMRLTALLLSAMMVAALLPAPAFASAAPETYEMDELHKDIGIDDFAPEEPETFDFGAEATQMRNPEDEPPLCSPDAVVGVGTFEELQPAINNAPDIKATTITITASFTMTGSITIPTDKNITLMSDATTHTLTRGSRVMGNLFNVESGAYLTVENITLDGNGDTVATHSLVEIKSGGTFTMNADATLQDNRNSTSGSGVYMHNGTFIMNGGAICSNSASSNSGGGVQLDGGTFLMTGGTISNNTAGRGGGVCIGVGTFIMTGGTISGNTATFNYNGGGGVFNHSGLINLGGSAVIQDNTNLGVVNNVELFVGRYITLGTDINMPTAEMRVGVTKRTENGVFVQSGAQAEDAARFFADNGKTVMYENGQLRVILDAYSVNSFTALQTAVANAPTDMPVTITVTVIFNMTGLITIPAGKDITITSDSVGINTLFRNAAGSLFSVENGAALTFEKIIIDGNKALYPDAGGALVRVSAGGVFYMADGAELRNNASGICGGVHVAEDGAFTMRGGVISGNSGPYGGGVLVANGGAFIMRGGMISGNSSIRGGVNLSGDNAEFSMRGGTISGNTDGCGVYVSSGVFTMRGGSISENTDGGGVFILGGAFAMTGGEIVGNATGESGGGVCVYTGSFAMSGGEISKNSAGDCGGGVYVSYGTLVLGGSSMIQDNSAGGERNNVYLTSSRYIALGTGTDAGGNGAAWPSADMLVGVTKTADNGVFVQSGAQAEDAALFFADNGYQIEFDNGQLRVTLDAYPVNSFTALQNAIANAPIFIPVTITVTASFPMTGLITIPEGKDITISSAGDDIFILSRSAAGNLVSVQNGAALTFENIVIDGNKVTYPDAGGSLVRVSGGTFTMKDGSTLQNNAYSIITGSGGGVNMDSGTFTLAGGTINGNSATRNGGGVYVSGGAFSMTGGVISGNSSGMGAGGVYMSGGTFSMTGGVISDNEGRSIGGNAGGVYVAGGSTLILGGGAVVDENTSSGAASNVVLAANCYVTLGTGVNAPASSMRVGVTKAANDGVFVNSGAQAGDAARFFADNGGVIEFDKGQLRIGAVTLPTAATPTASPGSGTVTAGTQVTLSCETQGATIRYTLDGSEPTETSAQYTGPITINATLTLKAKAYATGYTPSDTATYNYTVNVIDPNAPTITVNNAGGMPGKKAFVPISISNNPGITGMVIDVHYDETALRIIGFEDTRLLNAPIHAPVTKSPVTLAWADGLATVNNFSNGVIAILEFEVIAAEFGDYAVWVTYDYGNILNAAGLFVPFEIVNGHVTVIDFIYGDVNDDGIINLQDTYVLQRYIARWPDYPAEALNLDAADVYADGIINLQDAFTLQRHVARWPGYGTLPYIQGGPQALRGMNGAGAVIFGAPQFGAPQFGAQPFGDSKNDIPANDSVPFVMPTLSVGEAAGKAGETVKVPVTITRNPGITGLVFTLSFDDAKLRLVGYEDAGLLPGALHPPHSGLSFATFAWMNALAKADFTNSGVLVILEFQLLQDAEPGGYAIGLAYEPGNILNAGMAQVHFDVAPGAVTVRGTPQAARR